MEQHTLRDIAQLIDAHLVGEDCCISGIAHIRSAKTGQLSFVDQPAYRKYLATTQASAVIITEDLLEHCQTNALVVNNAYQAYVVLASHFQINNYFKPGSHPTAIVDPTAKIAASASIGPYVVIGQNTVIGEKVIIESGCTVGRHCVIGDHSHCYPRVTLYDDVQIGKNAKIDSGVVIGADGFGLIQEEGQWKHIPQLAGVHIGNKVSIGANTTIDCGALEPTQIGDGVKLDNLIQIAHNVKIGAHTAIAACVAIAGSTSIGEYCLIGGSVGIAGHLHITDRVSITGKSAVFRSIEKPGIYSSGVPLDETRTAKRNAARFAQLDKMAKRLKQVEKKMEKMNNE